MNHPEHIGIAFEILPYAIYSEAPHLGDFTHRRMVLKRPANRTKLVAKDTDRLIGLDRSVWRGILDRVGWRQ
jgi:hypothetical protein